MRDGQMILTALLGSCAAPLSGHDPLAAAKAADTAVNFDR
jgi:hypothetical protein